MSDKANERERFKKELFNELLEFHFDTRLGKNKRNELPWRTLLDDKIEPHAEILCDFSKWLMQRGWDKELVKDVFFIAVDEKETEKQNIKELNGWKKFWALFGTD
ncbi:MAG: hypothetical protein KGJ89_02120 [Patescibacteria group bacterium]|nr:hypothetical protein [Patescibacteria group bacterium]MDE2015673.1 hypothetical protein [Patescibacteria group bacterium]MDE2226730.1 hypothetical protein [Patescibacteria group bacterium]